MRTVNIDGKEVGLKGSPMTILYYRQEFDKDIVADIVALSMSAEDPTKIDYLGILKAIWAMNKTYNGVGKTFPNFEKWLEQFESVDFTDNSFMLDVVDEAQNGFFRGKNGSEGQLPR